MLPSFKEVTTSKLKVGARNSNLSRAQVSEVLFLIQEVHPTIQFDPIFLESRGDKDKISSLRSLEKTDFFTREIDLLVLSQDVRVGIHSAKDLPTPLREGLELIAVTSGIDSSDSLVMKEGKTVESLRQGALVATSSLRREENCTCLRRDFTFIDLRGTIEERLHLLEREDIDAIVVAECALIRLQLTHLNRVKLPGNPAALQGQLAVVAKKGDREMKSLFSCIDCRD